MNVTQEKKEYLFSPEQINDFSALGDVLKRIRGRLIADGYTIEAAKIYKKADIINPNEEAYAEREKTD